MGSFIFLALTVLYMDFKFNKQVIFQDTFLMKFQNVQTKSLIPVLSKLVFK